VGFFDWVYGKENFLGQPYGTVSPLFLISSAKIELGYFCRRN
jgi:hypothetical protein